MKSPTKSGRSTGSSQALPPHAAMKYRPYSTTCCVSSSTASLPFGELHMAYCSKPGQQANGQFFTPSHICELMVMCAEGKKKTGQRMGDPTCGSGRLLLAYHAHNPGNYLVGEDISRTCCMMTVCNMLVCAQSGKLSGRRRHQPDLLHDDRMQHARPRMCRGSDLS